MKLCRQILAGLFISLVFPQYYVVDLANTGVTSLHIFQDSITGLEVGDEIGLFDLEAITNYNDCSNQIGELLVGAGIWTGAQTEIVSIGSVDQCAFGGPQLAGYVDGNEVIAMVYRPSTGEEFGAEFTFSTGTGVYGEIIQGISEIVLVDPNACEDDDAGVSAFGGCAGAVAALGCDFAFAGIPISEWCPVTCDACPEEVIPGCTDATACNYNENATEDDGSCLSTFDCNGICGGSAIIDDCGICSEGNTGYIANADLDCNGVCFGDAFLDECGVCDDDSSNDCIQDCNGDWGGSAIVDECGVCGGDGPEENYNCDGTPELFSYVQSTQQAFYFFDQVFDLDNSIIDGEDWVGAFSPSSGVCVGARKWDTSGTCSNMQFDNQDDCEANSEDWYWNSCGGGVCDIPVMGFDPTSQDYTAGYMLAGELPLFKIYDASLNIYYDATPSEDLPWFNSTMYFVDSLSAEIFGCTSMNACNYNVDATIDDGSCEYAVENFDCDGNCIVDIDCLGECGGSAVEDECGVCEGDGSACQIFSFNQSSIQAYYFFDSVFLNGEQLDSDDWIGAFNGDVCVGARQILDCDGTCDIPVMGDDGFDYSEGYMQDGGLPLFKIYDSSEDAYYDALPSENILWSANLIAEIESLSGGIFGCTDPSSENYNSEATVDDGSCEYDDSVIPEEFVFNQSTLQAFYFVYNAMDVNGDSLTSNDWVAAFNPTNGLCVGAKRWDTSDCGNGICDVPVMGDDGADYTAGYMTTGLIPEFKIYDSSEGRYYNANPSQDFEWENFGFFMIDTLEAIEFGDPDLFIYEQSTLQAFYYFYETFDINGNPLDANDWIGVFNGNTCVGARQWDTSVCGGGLCDIPAMGDDGSPWTEGYLQNGDIPTFKIYDASEDEYYLGIPSEYFAWSNFEFFFADEIEAVDGQLLQLPLHYENNLISYPVQAPDPSIEVVFGDLLGNLESVIGQGTSSQQDENGNWIGTLMEVDPFSGYWLKLDDDDTLSIYGTFDPNRVYNLNQGNNLISYPMIDFSDIPASIPDNIENNIPFVIGESSATLQLEYGWVGSLTCFEPGRGYWVASFTDDLNFNYEVVPGLDQSECSDYNLRSVSNPIEYDIYNSTKKAFYFIDYFDGIDVGDWVLSYQNDVLVGARQWNGMAIDLPAMGNDNTDASIGFCENGDQPEFRLIKANGEVFELEAYIEPWSPNQVVLVENISIGHNTPNDFELVSIYPNPFNPHTNISVNVSSVSDIKLDIYDINGRLVSQLLSGSIDSGKHVLVWDATDFSSGIYFVRMDLNGKIQSQKIILSK